MALILCKECKREYSSYAKNCPDCACPTIVNVSDDLNSSSYSEKEPARIKSSFESLKAEFLNENFAEKYYYLLVALLLINFLTLFFTPYTDFSRFLTLILLGGTGIVCGRSFYSLTNQFNTSIVIGIAGIFSFVNVFILSWLIYRVHQERA